MHQVLIPYISANLACFPNCLELASMILCFLCKESLVWLRLEMICIIQGSWNAQDSADMLFFSALVYSLNIRYILPWLLVFCVSPSWWGCIPIFVLLLPILEYLRLRWDKIIFSSTVSGAPNSDMNLVPRKLSNSNHSLAYHVVSCCCYTKKRGAA
jgi:hypothetical protein